MHELSGRNRILGDSDMCSCFLAKR